MSHRIFVSNLRLHGFHGVLEAEKTLGQNFFIDIDCEVERPAGAGDDIAQTVCYAGLCDLAAEISKRTNFDLIESLGEQISLEILDRYSIVRSVTVEVRKPSAPISHPVDHVGISVTRSRNG